MLGNQDAKQARADAAAFFVNKAAAFEIFMAGKKKEVSLQVSISNDEQWGEMLAIKGLTVVDVFQQWCGPCRAVVSLFRKVKNELGDDLLHFAIAEADSIEALEKYRGKCEPTFLFYAGGELVAVLRGANAPLLQKMIVEELAKEKKVLEQDIKRIAVKDDGLIDEEEVQEETEAHEHYEDALVPANRSYTLGIIKPDVVAHGKTDEIIMKIQDAGFEILAHEERTLSESEAREFYRHKAAEPYFQELIRFMSSGPSHVLVISNPEGTDDVISAWQAFLGPAGIEEAKREHPESLRAQYGTEDLFNALHGSRDSEEAGRELAFFFPNFGPPEPEPTPVERTLALIRPDAARENRDEILARIHEAGFTVANQKEVTLTEEQVHQFYGQHQDEENFQALLTNMTSGPVLALVLAKQGAVELWRNLLGPKDPTQAKQEQPDSLRAQFTGESECVNQLHGSGSVEAAEREISFFFPTECTLAVIKPDTSEELREEILGEIRAAGFTISWQKEMVLTREMAEEFYKQHRDKPFFSYLVDYMCRGPCTMLILSKENAVEEWRKMMGPADPSKAKETAPGSLRARFAKDVLENTVHGSSSSQHAQEKIQLLFGEISSESQVISTGDDDEPNPLEESFAELKNLQTSRSPSFSELQNQTEPKSEEAVRSTSLSPEATETHPASSEKTLDLPEQKEDGNAGEQPPTLDLQGQSSDRVEES
ncbi:thioredoxin domain-containing protein 6 isoform X3 [Pangasianodon hypophthalmus]|uniref:thioredoxin domain-containing protein 6 isoform X3 n=1 Tax=Pangasianodon hypophthalmus TaxID=310915 RepID=UPI002307892E|nr:thioredoxin domain-containing protein 6 isoform X3 [Pangasianodon hypophthalmus]